MSARRLRLVGSGFALAAAVTYLFLYLYRWEWHRAILAAAFVIIAQLALLGALILDRLRSLEQRLDELAGPRAEEHERISARVHEAAPEPSSPFRWLEPDRMSVFVPVLLGAGVVLSMAAWLVERLARFTATATLERSLAGRLTALALPAGTLDAGWEAPPPALTTRRAHRLVRALVAVCIALALVLAIEVIADGTQNRADTLRTGTVSTVALQVSTIRPGMSDARATEHLWGACAQQLGTRYELVDLTPLRDGRALLTITPRIGTYAERRFRGCVEDATTDLVQARITAITTVG